MSILRGKKAGDPVVHDLYTPKYEAAGSVSYRLRSGHHDDWVRETVVWETTLTSPKCIMIKKYRDLESMKHVLPA